MKNPFGTIVTSLILSGLSLPGQTSLLEYWSFGNATDGSGLLDVNNSGSINSGWNHNTTAAGDTVDSGRMTFTGDEAYTRKAIPANPIELSTLGTAFRFEVNLAGWDLRNVAEGGKISFKLNQVIASTTTTFAQVILEKDSATTARIRFSTRLADGSQFYRNHAVNLTNNSSQNYAVNFLVGGEVNYLISGQVFETSTVNFGGVTEYTEALVVKDFTGDSGVAVEMDSLGFIAVPEPSSYALWLGCSLVLALVATRKF